MSELLVAVEKCVTALDTNVDSYVAKERIGTQCCFGKGGGVEKRFGTVRKNTGSGTL